MLVSDLILPVMVLALGIVAGGVTRLLRWPGGYGFSAALASLMLVGFYAGLSEQGIEAGVALGFFAGVFAFLPAAAAFIVGVWSVDCARGTCAIRR